MKLRFIPAIVAVSYFAVSCRIPRVEAAEPMIQGSAEIVSIEDLPWKVQSTERVVARGPIVITLRILEPMEFRAENRRLGVYAREELQWQGRELKVGQVLRFETGKEVLEELVEPDVFANFKIIEVVSKASDESPKRSNQ